MTMDEILETIEFLFLNKICVHIDTLDGSFYNGLIIEKSNKLLIIQDRIIGETPITISNITKINRFKEKIIK